MTTTNTTNAFTLYEALKAADNFRDEAIMELGYLIESLTDDMNRMKREAGFALTGNPEIRLRQVIEAATKATLMNRVAEQIEAR
jgi:hypothetical protein